MSRRASQRKSNPSQIFIYTEGETEKIYFEKLNQLKRTRERKRVNVRCTSKQGVDLFYWVRKQYRKHDFKTSPIEIVIVLDKDDTEPSELEELKKLCDEEGYKLAFCNECFELWVLLHFRTVTSPLSRTQLKQEIEKETLKQYKKTDSKFFEKLVTYVEKAILNQTHSAMGPELIYDKNPYTNVGFVISDLFNV